jgi:hypothetical protein
VRLLLLPARFLSPLFVEGEVRELVCNVEAPPGRDALRRTEHHDWPYLARDRERINTAVKVADGSYNNTSSLRHGDRISDGPWGNGPNSARARGSCLNLRKARSRSRLKQPADLEWWELKVSLEFRDDIR